MLDTFYSHLEMIRIVADDYPVEVVKYRSLKLNKSNIEYMLIAMYNAPTTIGSYNISMVSHDMYCNREQN